MKQSKEISTGRKLWECLNPFFFIIIASFMATLVVSAVLLIYGDMHGCSRLQIYNQIDSSSIWISTLMYLSFLIIKNRSIRFDKFKYQYQSAGWPVWKCILACIAAIVWGELASYFIDLIQLGKTFTGYEEASQSAFGGQPLWLLLAVVVVLGPIAEELLFRRMILGRIKYYFGSRWAIVISALLFGIYHGNMVQFVYAGLLGLGFGYIYDKSGNIRISIVAHMCLNLLAVLGSFL